MTVAGAAVGSESARGHAVALLTILIWGTTFISTKVLLKDFQPVEILFFRFALGLVALAVVCPKRLGKTTPRQELTFAAAGACGVCLYYLLENVALTLTMASNVGVIISVAPLFTALLSRRTPEGARPLPARFFFGFAVAIAGVALISFNGSALSLSPLGDGLALLAAAVWACYSVLTRKIAEFGFETVPATRRTFAYGLLFMVPTLFLTGFDPGLARFSDVTNLANILFLGLGASALCFVTWSVAVRDLGAVKTSAYIYLVPVVTVTASALVLGEPVSWISVVGTGLTLAGLLLSET